MWLTYICGHPALDLVRAPGQVDGGVAVSDGCLHWEVLQVELSPGVLQGLGALHGHPPSLLDQGTTGLLQPGLRKIWGHRRTEKDFSQCHALGLTCLTFVLNWNQVLGGGGSCGPKPFPSPPPPTNILSKWSWFHWWAPPPALPPPPPPRWTEGLLKPSWSAEDKTSFNPLKMTWFWFNMHFQRTQAKVKSGLVFNRLIIHLRHSLRLGSTENACFYIWSQTAVNWLKVV